MVQERLRKATYMYEQHITPYISQTFLDRTALHIAHGGSRAVAVRKVKGKIKGRTNTPRIYPNG